MRIKDSSDTTSSDQKRSVFERLGNQSEKADQMKRKPSPGKHGDYMQPPPPGVHEAEFGMFGMDSQAEMNWRLQNDRRYMPPMHYRDRHPMQPPGPPPPQQPGPPPPHMAHYDMEVMSGRGQHPYYMHSMPPYHNGPPGMPGMGPSNMPIGVHPQRSSPKYDRHGNPIPSMKDRMGPMEQHHHSMSPPGHFMAGMMMPGMHPMVHPDMPPMRSRQMYPPYSRWGEPGVMESDFPPYMVGGRMLAEEGFSPPHGMRRYPQHPLMSPPPPQIGHPQAGPPDHQMAGEIPRYARWRERRDVITSLDRETAQSSSRTDSLRSSLQQPDMIRSFERKEAKAPNRETTKTSSKRETKEKKSTTDSSETKDPQKSKETTKTDPQDISDGEIVDDEDSSDESEMTRVSDRPPMEYMNGNYATHHHRSMMMPPYPSRPRESQQYYEAVNKKRRLHERDDYSLDYETISDDDLDIYMGDKKEMMEEEDEGDSSLKNKTSKDSIDKGKVSSEIELLDALGLDWANLVEMAKQSRNSNRAIIPQPGAALKRFSPANYIPSLCIDPKLVGPDLYELILNTCRT